MNDANTNTRINARIDRGTQERIDELMQVTGQTASHVVREAIAVYHAQVRREQPRPMRLLAMTGQGRSRDGRTDVATHYKQILADSLAAKYRLPPKPRAVRKP